jgi:uncharacterized protein (TIGR02001 family)
MNFKSTAALALIALLSGTAAVAQTKAPEPDFTLSYNVGATTDYRFRSLSQTSFGPALQAGADFSHKSGLYLGVWGANINWIKDYVGATKGSMELDLYGGFKTKVAKDLGLDLGLITYQYPGNTAGNVTNFVNANTTEIYGALSYKIVTVKYSYSTSNFIANSNSSGSYYVEAAANLDVGNGFTVTPHVGYQSIPNVTADAGNYTDFSLTVAKDLGNGLSVSVAAYATDAKDSFYKVSPTANLGKTGLAVGVKYSF